MRRILLSLVFSLVALPGFAQARHPFTFEDMMKLKRVGEPEVSPDGKWVIFSVVEVDLEANTKTPHIWIVPLAGSETAGSSTAQDASPSANHPATVGMTEDKSGIEEKFGVPHARPDQDRRVSPSLREVESKERELIADQDGDRPRWAPDGKRFAFISTKEGGSQVWIADFDSTTGTVSGVHRLTSIATEAGGELWSPDGKNILFTSDVYPECDGQIDEGACNAKKLDESNKSKTKAQTFTHLLYRHWNAYKEGKRTHILMIPVDACVGTAALGCPAGAPRDLTPGDYDAPVFSLGGQDNYAFSPDGQEICYSANQDKNPAASTNNDLWIVPVNVGTDQVGTAASPVRSGEAGQNPVELRSTRQPGAAVATQDAAPNPYVAAVLAQTKNITADNPASDSTPLYSPDGRYIAYRAQQRPGYEADRFRLMLYDRKSGEKKNLTEGFEQWVGTYTWAPDSKAIYFASAHKHHSLIYVVSLAPENGWPSYARSLVGGYDDDLAFTPDGKTLIFGRQSLTAPTEIYAAGALGLGCPSKSGDVDEGKDSCSLNKDWPVTHVNDSLLSQISTSKIESFFFKGAHDDSVEGYLIQPPNFDAAKKYPVKFLIHGGPQGAWGDDWSYRWNAELFAAPTPSQSSGYVVIMINFHGSTGYGQKFIDAINGDWGGAPFEDLMKGLDYAEKTYPFIDKNRECALGASYGGYMINWILGHTDRFKCLVSHDGMFNAESAWGTTEELWFNDWEFKGTPYDNRAAYEKWSPHQYAKNFKTPTLVIHGQRDYRLDVSEGLQLFTTLQMEGVPSKMLYFPDEGHWVLKPQNSQLWYQTVNDWVDQWTKK